MAKRNIIDTSHIRKKNTAHRREDGGIVVEKKVNEH